MLLTITATLMFGFLLLLLHRYLEISALKYGLLKAMATQSKAVDRELRSHLRRRRDCKILNKEYKKFEKIYLTHLNMYMFQFSGMDSGSLRKEILDGDPLEL